MADDGSAQSTSIWPMPKFHFEANWNGETTPFQEVTGLDVEAQPIEHRHGTSKAYSTVKMPGLIKHGNVTLKKGVFKSGSKFRDWVN
jgi:phage tail-like protein